MKFLVKLELIKIKSSLGTDYIELCYVYKMRTLVTVSFVDALLSNIKIIISPHCYRYFFRKKAVLVFFQYESSFYWSTFNFIDGEPEKDG